MPKAIFHGFLQVTGHGVNSNDSNERLLEKYGSDENGLRKAKDMCIIGEGNEGEISEGKYGAGR